MSFRSPTHASMLVSLVIDAGYAGLAKTLADPRVDVGSKAPRRNGSLESHTRTRTRRGRSRQICTPPSDDARRPSPVRVAHGEADRSGHVPRGRRRCASRTRSYPAARAGGLRSSRPHVCSRGGAAAGVQQLRVLDDPQADLGACERGTSGRGRRGHRRKGPLHGLRRYCSRCSRAFRIFSSWRRICPIDPSGYFCCSSVAAIRLPHPSAAS